MNDQAQLGIVVFFAALIIPSMAFFVWAIVTAIIADRRWSKED